MVFSSVFVYGHEGEEEEEVIQSPSVYLPADPFTIATYVFLLVLVLSVLSIFFQGKMGEKTKKIVFVIVAVTVFLTTIYAAGSTVYLNVVSESGGPIHWHADFEIWVCGEKAGKLEGPEGLSNRVGTPVFHHHDDQRIHVEGIVVKKEDIELGKFFDSIGGEFHADHLKVKLESGDTLEYSNGDECPDGKAGKWRMYLKNFDTGNFEENLELNKYVLKPFFNVPPGDYLVLTFDSKEGVPLGS
ncbi:MAG: hypothetical protein HY392_01025 [Candidatus Diapherotrites archaeon]|nr:hypothetical protein [Candidatus Diapherotrites archaeon]